MNSHNLFKHAKEQKNSSSIFKSRAILLICLFTSFNHIVYNSDRVVEKTGQVNLKSD